MCVFHADSTFQLGPATYGVVATTLGVGLQDKCDYSKQNWGHKPSSGNVSPVSVIHVSYGPSGSDLPIAAVFLSFKSQLKTQLH